MEAESGPWQRLDPDQLRKSAELKEAKAARKELIRVEHAAARREKRHAKSEAKLARKSNVKRAAKWNEERKAVDKQKKLANRPAKQERKRKRMLQRADKLEAQAKKLYEEARRARARYGYLTELKEKEDAEKNRIFQEVEAMEKAGNDEYTPIDTDDSALDLAQAAETDETADLNPNMACIPAAASQSGKPQLVADTADGISRMDCSNIVEGEAGSPRVKKDKKDKKAKKEKKIKVDEVDEKETLTEKKEKKEKEEQEEQEDGIAEPTKDVIDEDAKAAKKARKAEKKRKREMEAAANGAEGGEATADDTPARKDKKKRKKSAVDGYEESATAAQDSVADESEQWNVDGLEGGADRQAKFLRLLGGKKKGNAEGTGTRSAGRDHLDMTLVADDLQRQFESGMKMKFESQGQRRGLGA